MKTKIIFTKKLANINSYNRDTNEYQNSDFFKQHPNAIRLDLYYDDIELANPLGSKRGKHKMGMFYFTIQNFPIAFSSNIKNIFNVIVCHSWDIKKYGFRKILHQLVHDLKNLENGVIVTISNNQPYELRAILVSLSGDSLAVHEILGMLSPSCKCFCRECMITREDFNMNKGIYDDSIPKRSKELHVEQLEQIQQNPSLMSMFGVREDTILNELKYFHSTSDAPFDPFHDLLEGTVCKSIVKVLTHFINNQYFTVDYLNTRIFNFRYGAPKSKNKPSANFENNHFNSKKAFSQNGIQTWLLLRSLPFLIGHLIPEIDLNYLYLLVFLMRIIEISISVSISPYMLLELEESIDKHEKLFVELFPSTSLINKHHHMRHYPEIIKKKGPLIQFWCHRKESKHGEVKKQIQVAKTNINLPFSISNRQSFLQNRNISQNNYEEMDVIIQSFSTCKLSSRSCTSKFPYLLESYGDINIKDIKCIKVNGCLFQNNYIIIHNNTDEYNIFPIFFNIIEIVKI